MPIDDRGGHVYKLSVRRSRVLTQHPEGSRLVDRVALHQDSFRPLGDRPAPERAFEIVVFGEAAQDDVDRALPRPACHAGGRGFDSRRSRRSRKREVEFREPGDPRNSIPGRLVLGEL
jgi:hypothetical protein